jgi:GT2 family glycosyltransferase/glycosyltransferase involved in cell wall biosynthesis
MELSSQSAQELLALQEQANVLVRVLEDQTTALGAMQSAMNLAGALCADVKRAADEGDDISPEEHVYDLIIPNFNAPDILKSCLDSLIAHTDPKHLIYVIDDASSDPRVHSMLREYIGRWPHVRYYRLSTNLGFPGAVNTGLSVTKNDVILVNSDTEFPPHWLARMDRCRRSHPRLHVVCPLSNNATICSVPRMNEKNALPAGMTVTDMDRLVARSSLHRYPRVPTVVGFCMLMTRESIDNVGPLDMTFGRGYGEEVDWCQRAWAKGYESAICDDLYVFHHGEVGFSQVAEKKTLQTENERRLATRWPNYHPSVMTHCVLNPLRYQQQRLFELLRRGPPKELRVLHVVHSFGQLAGTELFTRHLIDGMRAEAASTVLVPSAHGPYRDAEVEEEPDGLIKIKMSLNLFPIEHAIRNVAVSMRSRSVERFFSEVVTGTGADIVQFSHFANLGSFALPLVARAVGARVVIVLHDYFLLCPDWNLVHAEGRACGKAKVDDSVGCANCLKQRLQSRQGMTPPQLTQMIGQRTALARLALEHADALIAPSTFVREQFRRAFGDPIADRIRVIPHGTARHVGKASYRPEKRLRVAFLGNAEATKGWRVFLDVVRQLRATQVRFRLLGALPPNSGVDKNDNVDIVGQYQPAQLPALLEDVDVVFIGSIWDETYCYTLDEAFRAGTPVIASAVGAIRERVSDGRTGLLVPPNDVAAVANAVKRIDADRSLLASMRRNVAELRLKTIEDNVAEYLALYRSLATSEPRSDLVRATMAGNADLAVAPQVGLRDFLAKAGIDMKVPPLPESPE